MRDKLSKEIIDLVYNINPNIKIEDLDERLEDLGIDSVEFIQLIVAIEERYGIVFEDDKLNTDNLDTIHKFTEYVMEMTCK